MGKKKKKSMDIADGSENGNGDVMETTQDVPETTSAKSEETKPWARSQIKDGRLIPRIKEFLGSRKNKKAVNVFGIVDHLQSKYPEYGRKKRQMFIQYVERAYAVLQKAEKSLFEGDNISGADRSDSDDDVLLVEYKDSNAMNTMMSNLYKGGQKEGDGATTPVKDEKKRKIEPSDSVKKRQKIEAYKVNSPVVRLERISTEGFFIDRQGNSKSEKVDNSGDSAREKPTTIYKNGVSSHTSSRKTPIRSKDLNVKTARSAKVCVADVMKQRGASSDNVLVSDQSSRDSVLLDRQGKQEAVDIENNKERLAEQHADARVEQLDTEATKTPGRSKRDKGTKKVKGGSKTKQQDVGDKDKPKKEKGPAIQMSSLTFADVGGNEQNLQEICKLLVHMRHPEVYLRLGVTPPRGFLLHGPPGCGKTLLANAIAGELDLPLIKLAATEIVSGMSGESEERIRELFEKAVQCSPCVMFIDEIDAITPKRETASKDMERRIVAQLLACMDDLNSNPDAQVLVIGATNRPDSLDPALRRAGRFDREICLGIPDEQSRLRILQVLCRDLRLSQDFDFLYLAKNTPGYVGADLMALTREAAMSAVNRVFQELQSQVDPGGETAMEVDSSDASIATTLQQDVAQSSETVAPSELKEPVNEQKTTTIQDQTLEKQETSKAVNLEEQPQLKTDPDDVENNVKDIVPSPETDLNTVSSEDAGRENSDDKTTSGENLNSGKSDSVDTDTSKTELNSSVVDVESDPEPRASGSGMSYTDTTSNSALAAHTEGSKDIEDVGPSETGCEHVDATEKEQHKKQSELLSVLSWLKEQPPLTEAQLNDLFITMEDFKEALKYVQPSAKREGFATVPDVTWDDIGALHHVREELQLAILAPVRHAEDFRSLGLNRAQGVLLAGPPGCGKTLLAKAVANESGINFISVKGPELLNMYVGESEKAVRTVFQRARNSAPCVIFFDELDALCPRRSTTSDSGSSTRVVNQLLTEMDGLEERKQVFIMAATNRPDIIDPAIMRPGRLDKTLYVGLPTKEDRLDIFRCITKDGTKPCLGDGADLTRLAEDQRCEGYTGADLAALVREASVLALKEAIVNKGRQPGDTITVMGDHFKAAFRKIKPSVSAKDQEMYRTLGEKMTSFS